MIPKERVEQGLAEIRRRRGWMWVVFFGFFPVVLFAAFVISRFRPGPEGETTTMFVALIWMAVFAVAAIRVGWVRCPRCGKRFHQRRKWGVYMWSNPFTRRCLNCQLPLAPSNKPLQPTRVARSNGQQERSGSTGRRG